MQSVSSRIWTRVAVFISYDDNHYTTGTSLSAFDVSFCHKKFCLKSAVDKKLKINILEWRVTESFDMYNQNG